MGQRLDAMVCHLKVAILAAVVICAFLFSSLTWRHVESSEQTRVLVAAAILVAMYTLMIFELINRTLAAMVGAAASVAAYDCLVEHASMEQIVGWQDLETLALLFGMMIVVNVLATSGLFDFLAVWSYKKSGGHFWLLVTILSLLTGTLSAFMDNVSTMLLMTPTLIKLSELEHIEPRYLLMIMVVFSNIGGTATPVGDPPNLIIIGDPLIGSLQITFSSFVAYCAPCVLLTIFTILVYLKLLYKSKESFRPIKPTSEHELQNAASTHTNSPAKPSDKHHALLELTSRLKALLNEKSARLSEKTLKELQRQLAEVELSLGAREGQLDNYQQMKSDQLSIELAHALGSVHVADQRRGSRLTNAEIKQLQRHHSIKSKPALVLSLAVLTVAVLLFFVQSLPNTQLTLGWISIFASITLLVLSSSLDASSNDSRDAKDETGPNKQVADEEEEEESADNFERILAAVEWSTLLFFFALFIVMEVMAKLGLIQFVGTQIIRLVDVLPAGPVRTAGAITIMLWASGFASALIDNVPFTSMMIKVIGSMAASLAGAASEQEPTLPVAPLVFALAFGACYGGNGTLIGASANLVTAGMASRRNHPISFNQFFAFCAPITALSLLVANVYLVLVFVVLQL